MASFRQSLRELLRWFSAVDPSTERSTRGMQLLTRNLSLAQRKQYAMHGYFDVIGGDTGKRYRIRHGCLMNIEQLDQNNRRVQLLCFTPRGRLPVGDIMLAQKIALELFETDVLRVANRSPAWDYLLEGDARATRRYRHQ
jgi:hypothetical protein